MFNQYTAQLRSRDPEQRKAAIRAMARDMHDDPEIVLKLLETVYKKDPDPEVRYAALQAGRYLHKFVPERMKMPERSKLSDFKAAAESSGSASYGESRGYAPQADSPLIEPVPVSDKQIEKGNELKKLAFDANMRGETKKAINLLRQAFKTNPNLMRNGHALSLACTFTGIKDGREAVAAITGGSIKVASNSGAYYDERRIRALRGYKEEGTWLDAGIWIAVLTGVLALGPVLLAMLLLQILLGLATRGGSFDLTYETNALLSVMLFLAVFSVAYLFVQLCFTHVFARYLFKGEGQLPNLIYRIARFQSLVMLAYLVAVAVFFFVLLFMMFFMPRVAIAILGVLGIFGPLIQFAVLLGQVLWTVKIVADVYRNSFGFFKAVASMILGALITSAIAYGLFFLLGQIAGNWFEQLLRRIT